MKGREKRQSKQECQKIAQEAHKSTIREMLNLGNYMSVNSKSGG